MSYFYVHLLFTVLYTVNYKHEKQWMYIGLVVLKIFIHHLVVKQTTESCTNNTAMIKSYRNDYL